jgi:hypothetical protein
MRVLSEGGEILFLTAARQAALPFADMTCKTFGAPWLCDGPQCTFPCVRTEPDATEAFRTERDRVLLEKNEQESLE